LATSFACTVEGEVTITLTAKQEGCSETLTASVACLAQADAGSGDGGMREAALPSE
jgi:hypothetical protein